MWSHVVETTVVPLQELEIAEKEERRLRREEDSKKVKDEEEAGPSGPPDADGPTPMEAQLSGLDERYIYSHSVHGQPWELALTQTNVCQVLITELM